MSRIIMACDSLRQHINAAQKKAGTDYQVLELDSDLHVSPEKMRESVFEHMSALPGAVDTVLLAMGLCGGSVSDQPLPKRTVIPKVDDCITLLLHKDESWHANLKECGHLYLTDTVDGNLSVENIRDRLFERYGEKKGRMVFDIWFAAYRSVDIIDTGVYDCYSDQYIKSTERNADLIHCPVCYVPGSNLLLEKLVKGQWDHQFIVAEKGQTLIMSDFNK